MSRIERQGKGKVVRGVVLSMALAVAVGCDTTVTNPGPVADQFLDDPGAHSSVLQGARLMVSGSLWKATHVQSEMAGDQFRAGANYVGGVGGGPGRFMDRASLVMGSLTRRDLQEGFWLVMNQAPWVAEDAIRRFEEVGADPNLSATAHLLAGFANRLAGEYLCFAVIDGGSPQPPEVRLQRAEDQFRGAMQIADQTGASEVAMAARAGLAQVLGPGLGDWDEAASIAAEIPIDFRYQAVYSTETANRFNQVVFITDGAQFRDWTTWDTFFEDYYAETGDPRARWEDTGSSDTPAGVPLIRQRKWTNLGDNINLVSGREMMLIRAEALLRAGAWEQAVDLINELRAGQVSDLTGQPIAQSEASSLEEAWTDLKRERRIELWLEGRTMFDLRRWIAEGTPGAMRDMSPFERLCIPIAQSEIDNNPNIPLSWDDDPVNPIWTGG